MIEVHTRLLLFVVNVAAVWESVNYTAQDALTPSETMAERLKWMEQHCRQLGFTAAAVSAARLAHRYVEGGITNAQMKDLYVAFRDRLEDELGERLCFVIEPTRLRYFDGSETLLSGTVPRKFQAADTDFREACKCFALNRYTACVFHLLRVMETPLAVISKQLSIKPVTGQTTWGDYLGKMRPAITRLPQSTPRERRVKEHFDGLEARISAIQTAWRNPTIHRVDRVYDEDEARDLIELARGLFRTAVKRR